MTARQASCTREDHDDRPCGLGLTACDFVRGRLVTAVVLLGHEELVAMKALRAAPRRVVRLPRCRYAGNTIVLYD